MTLETYACINFHSSYIVLVQELFMDKSQFRTISSNCCYLIIFPGRRNINSARILFRQMYGKEDVRSLMNIFEDLSKSSFGYLVIDLTARACENLRLRSHLFDPFPRVYSLN